MGLTPQIMTPHRSLAWDRAQAPGLWHASHMICYSARVENHCLNSKWTITFSLKPTPIHSTDFSTSHLTWHRTSALYEDCLPTYLPLPSLHVPLSKNASRAGVWSSTPRNSLRDAQLPNQMDTFVSWSRSVPGLCAMCERTGPFSEQMLEERSEDPEREQNIFLVAQIRQWAFLCWKLSAGYTVPRGELRFVHIWFKSVMSNINCLSVN